jgi:hypothetical protein
MAGNVEAIASEFMRGNFFILRTKIKITKWSEMKKKLLPSLKSFFLSFSRNYHENCFQQQTQKIKFPLCYDDDDDEKLTRMLVKCNLFFVVVDYTN